MHTQVDENRGESIRAALIEKRSEILSCLGVDTTHVAAADRVSEEDRPQVFHDEFVALLLNGLEYERLRMIDEALDRLNAGDFGSCLACGRAISPLRLQAIPWVRYCVICQNHVTSMGHEPVVRANRVPVETIEDQQVRCRL